MRTFMKYEDIETLCEAIVKDYLKKKHYTNIQCLDIEGLVTEYMGGTIQYESFAELDGNRVGFLSDGKTALHVFQDGKEYDKVFPRQTVVIERGLLCPQESGRKRFTIAHEAGHILLERYMGYEAQPVFHSEYDSKQNYSKEMLQQLFNLTEMYADRVGACLLMPRFLVQRALKKHNAEKAIVAYGEGIISRKEKVTLQRVADALGVSFSACMNRLRELKLIEYRPIEEYIHNELGFGGECVEG